MKNKTQIKAKIKKLKGKEKLAFGTLEAKKIHSQVLMLNWVLRRKN